MNIPGVIILPADFHTKGTGHVCFTTDCCNGNEKILVFRYIFASRKSVYKIIVQLASGSMDDIHDICFLMVEVSVTDKLFLISIIIPKRSLKGTFLNLGLTG